MTHGRLVELALGAEEARKVDLALPQNVFDVLTESGREDAAGWYYEQPMHNIFGRLLTVTECWMRIRERLEACELLAFLDDNEITTVAAHWPCLRSHCEADEVQIRTIEEQRNVYPQD